MNVYTTRQTPIFNIHESDDGWELSRLIPRNDDGLQEFHVDDISEKAMLRLLRQISEALAIIGSNRS